jgi:hypothetical protein
MSADEERNFLARWSQRKREAAKEAEQQQAVAPAAEAAVPAEPEEEDFDLSLLPSLEEMTPSTDLTLFFKKGVPEALRNAALRKMWALDPAIRDYRSEALDYAYDWNVPGGVPGGGDLPEGFDSSEMVARIFGDAPTDENVIGNVAVQQDQKSSDENRLDPPAEVQIEAVERQNPEAQQQFSESILAQPTDAAPQKIRRHGSALPSS